MADCGKLYFSGGSVLTGDECVDTSLLVEDGVIAAVGGTMPASAREIALDGLALLPGLVDVHGDAFERQISPRPGVHFPLDLAMQETDRQLAANAITTAYHGLTLSWEPGLRSIDNGRAFLSRFEELRDGFAVDHRIQLRWETFAFEGIDLVREWLTHPVKPALAFNDHTTATLDKLRGGKHHAKLEQWASRAGLLPSDYVALVVSLEERSGQVPETIGSLAEAARNAGAPLLSHDDRSLAERIWYRDKGAKVAEFPLVAEAAADARAHDEHVVLGAPNVVRGGSHVGALVAEDSVLSDLCTVLASDYFYPSMLRAAAILARRQGLARAWATVSANAADAMGLADRGRIAPGLRADLVVTRFDGAGLTPVATYCAGIPVWRGPGARH